MPPPIPLSGAGAWYSAGSQPGSARSSAKAGLMASQAEAGEAARADDLLARLSAEHAMSAQIPDPVREPRQRQNSIAREVVELTMRMTSGLFGLPNDVTAGGTHAAGSRLSALRRMRI
jgi:hypothetical protein